MTETKFELLRAGPCPKCGASIEFASASATAQICKHCNYIVARTDRDFTLVGRMADLIAIRSPFAVGAAGSIEGHRFIIGGRVQYDRAQAPGAPWDEFCLELATGGFSWLSHAQGKWILTALYTEWMPLPSFESVEPGLSIAVPSGEVFKVVERGSRRAVSGEGELPFPINPEDVERFVDLSGPEGHFATIDYGAGTDPPQIYFGREIDPLLVHLDGGGPGPTTPTVSTEALTCPGCGGNLPLVAPDVSERIVCRYCGQLSDVKEGALRALRKLPLPPIIPLWPLGTKGHLRGRDVTIVGLMVRSTTIEEERFPWREYLLYAGAAGFLWLMEEDGRFEHILPIALGDIGPGPTQESRVYKGDTYTQGEPVFAQVDYVVGEFYWRVEVGEAVEILEFSGPRSQKVGEERSGTELSVSFSRPIDLAELERAFGKVTPGAVAIPAKPSTFFLAMAAAWLLISLVYFVQTKNAVVFDQHILLAMPPVDAQSSSTDTSYFSDPFVVAAGERNLKVSFDLAIQNTWSAGEIALVNADTGHVWEDDFELSYYTGVEDGETWSEGSRTATVWFSRMPAGTYTLRIDPSWDKVYAPPPLHVEIRSDAPATGYVFGAGGILFGAWAFAAYLAWKSKQGAGA